MANRYSAEFKEQAVKCVLAEESVAKVARDFAINVNSLLYMETNRTKHQVVKMAQWLNVSRSGYYAWRKRHLSLRDMENRWLLGQIRRIHEEYQHVYGSHKMTEELNSRMQRPINHKRVERIMKENGIRSK